MSGPVCGVKGHSFQRQPAPPWGQVRREGGREGERRGEERKGGGRGPEGAKRQKERLGREGRGGEREGVREEKDDEKRRTQRERGERGRELNMWREEKEGGSYIGREEGETESRGLQHLLLRVCKTPSVPLSSEAKEGSCSTLEEGLCFSTRLCYQP